MSKVFCSNFFVRCPKSVLGCQKASALQRRAFANTKLYHAFVQYGKRCKSHNMQALLGLNKVLFLDRFCLNLRYYTIDENELQLKTSMWIFFNLTDVLNNTLHIFMSIETIFPLCHKALWITNLHFVNAADMLPTGLH